MELVPRQVVGPDSSQDRSGSVPSDWHEAATRRLGWVAGIALGIGLLALPMSLLRQANLGPRAGFERPLWLIPVGITASLVMLLVARSKSIPARRRLDGGLGYLVVMCGVASVFRHSLPYAAADVTRGFSPVVVAVVFFAVIVPLRPARIGVAAALAALTDPLALLALVQFGGHPTPPWNLWLWLFAPNLFAVALSVLVAQLLYTLGQTVQQARKMGRYRLVELLGKGGMGEVWRAEHDTLARRAAIKLIRPDMLGARDPESRERAMIRFEREAQATALLGSPHTIEVYDYGVTEDGTFFYVMELLEGRDLEEVLEQSGALPPERTVHLLEQVCHSLRDAHAAQVVHRDIKPANVYVCHKGAEYDFVKVLDFGLAKRLSGEEIKLTQADSLTGTPAYMPPEAVMGQEVDFRADIYALGCLAYRMLAGREPFDAPTVMAVLMKHVQEAPTPLSEVCTESLPPALESLVMRCLAKAPEDRPADAAEVLSELEQTGLGESWSQAQAHAWWSEHERSDADVAQLGSAPTVLDEALAETALEATVELELPRG